MDNSGRLTLVYSVDGKKLLDIEPYYKGLGKFNKASIENVLFLLESSELNAEDESRYNVYHQYFLDKVKDV